MIEIGLTILYYDKHYVRVVGVHGQNIEMVICKPNKAGTGFDIVMETKPIAVFLKHFVATQEKIKCFTTNTDVSSYWRVNPEPDVIG